MAMTGCATFCSRVLLAATVALPGCMKAREPNRLVAPTVVFEDNVRRDAFPVVMVLLAASSHTREVWRALGDEIRSSFDVITRVVAADTTAQGLAHEIGALQPNCIVLMGNRPLNLYREFQARHAGPFPPAVVVMASFFEEQRSLVRNTTGIAYEIPGVTTFVHLRAFTYGPVWKVGVVYRPMFSGYMEEQQRLASLEEVQLVGREVSEAPGLYGVRRALDHLIRREQVDAIWVLNDNVLLEPELIAKGWLKLLHKHPTMVVVGVGSLVDPRLHFGCFAMLPDHTALGVQAANLIFRLAEKDWRADDMPVELPLSVKSVVDLSWARRHFHLREGALDHIDRVVK